MTPAYKTELYSLKEAKEGTSLYSDEALHELVDQQEGVQLYKYASIEQKEPEELPFA